MINIVILYLIHFCIAAIAGVFVQSGKVKLVGGAVEFEDRADFLCTLFILGPLVTGALALIGFVFQLINSLRK